MSALNMNAKLTTHHNYFSIYTLLSGVYFWIVVYSLQKMSEFVLDWNATKDISNSIILLQLFLGALMIILIQ